MSAKQTMNCVMKTASGIGNLEYTQHAIPTINPKEILVHVKAAAICGTDVHIKNWNEWAKRRMSPPVIIGHEFSGEVEAIGDEVHSVKVGDRVSSESHIACNTCDMCRAGHRHVCRNTSIIGVHQNGAFAEYIAIPEEIAFVCPNEKMSWEELALMEPFGVVVHGMTEYPLMGRTVAIIGAGPLGSMAVLLAKKAGAAKIFILEPNKSRAEFARKLGADVTVNPISEDPVEAIKNLSGGRGVNIAVDCSGSIPGLTAATEYLAPEGKLICIAIPSKPFTFNLAEFSYRGCTIKGIAGRKMYETWEDIRGILTGGIDLSPIVTHKLPMSEFARGLEMTEQGKCCKCVLIP